MNTKIIFFDIDGTILNTTTDLISDSTKIAIKRAQANGHLAFVNTGRTMAEIEDAIKEVGFDGYVCGCGTYISYHDKVLYEGSISTDLMKKIILDLRNYHIDAVLEGSTAIYYDKGSTHPIINRHRNAQENIRHFNLQPWEDSDISFCKFCIWPTKASNFAGFYEDYKDIFDFITCENSLYEVVLKGHSKATGIEFLLSHLDISLDHTYALGDGPNDLPMLEYVKHSIGMGNSSDDIREIVSYITEDVDRDGVSVALKHFNII